MNYIVSASTDIGNTKSTNQDSLTVKVFNTLQGKIAFSVLCDGMGGLSKGELASATVIKAFNDWTVNELPLLCENEIDMALLEKQWTDLVVGMNEKISAYGKSQGVQLGTTVIAMLLTEKMYCILNVGDSRAYAITDSLQQLTNDHTVVAREVEMGVLTLEQAKTDSRRSVLLQCVGASNVVRPDIFWGQTKPDTVYMLCSDGFRHEISPDEIFAYLNPAVLPNATVMKTNTDYMINLNKQRQERDNISVVLIRTIQEDS